MGGSGEIKVFIKERKKCISMIGSADLIILVDFNQSAKRSAAGSINLSLKSPFLTVISLIPILSLTPALIRVKDTRVPQELFHKRWLTGASKMASNKLYVVKLSAKY